MAKALASTTRIKEVVADSDSGEDKKSDTSSDLRLSYLDDVPLKTRFPDLKPPVPLSGKDLPKPGDKPLTIILPASNVHKPLKSVTDILRELRTPAREVPPALRFDGDEVAFVPPRPVESETTSARFGGAEVVYSASALQSEATAFASTLADSGLPSQPSPTAHDDEPLAPTSQLPTTSNV